MSLKKFINYVNSEQNLIKTIFVSILTSFVIILVLYFFKLKYIEKTVSSIKLRLRVAEGEAYGSY